MIARKLNFSLNATFLGRIPIPFLLKGNHQHDQIGQGGKKDEPKYDQKSIEWLIQNQEPNQFFFFPKYELRG